MKKLGRLGKFFFFVNSIFAILLLLGYLLPYIPPSMFPKLAVLSLLLPVLMVVNVLFVIYWTFRMRRQLLLSALVLVLGIGHITSHLRFESSASLPIGHLGAKISGEFSILSYNVHSFTKDGTVPRSEIVPQITKFLTSEAPDIICFQEYHPYLKLKETHPYKYQRMRDSKKTFGQVIFSKYPIIKSGSLNFPKSGNNGIYADIVKGRDTLRVYNIHFQSFRLSADFDDLQKEDSKRLLGRMGDAFKKQESQMKLFLAHEANAPYPVIVAGDFNNSATSYIYRKVKGDKTDAFAEAGSGLGQTFTFDFVPLRIDFMLAAPELTVKRFQNYDLDLSDHEPILGSFELATMPQE